MDHSTEETRDFYSVGYTNLGYDIINNMDHTQFRVLNPHQLSTFFTVFLFHNYLILIVYLLMLDGRVITIDFVICDVTKFLIASEMLDLHLPTWNDSKGEILNR